MVSSQEVDDPGMDVSRRHNHGISSNSVGAMMVGTVRMVHGAHRRDLGPIRVSVRWAILPVSDGLVL